MNIQRIGTSLRTWLAVFAFAFTSSGLTHAQHNIDFAGRSEEDKKLLKTAQNLHNRSRTHYDWGRYDAAIADLGQAKKIMEQVEGPDSPIITTFINNLAYYYRAKGELGPVESLLSEVVERNMRESGDDSVEACMAELHLASFWRDRGLAERSESLYVAALERLERSSDDLEVLKLIPGVLRNIAESLAERGALKEAESMLLRSLKISEDIAGEGTAATGPAMSQLALFYSVYANRHAEAEALFIRLLEIIEPVHGPSNQVWTVQENLGMSYLRSGKYAEAEKILKERYDFERGDPFLETMGSPKLAHSASRLGELYWAKGELELALPLWTEAGNRYARHENAALAIGSEVERMAYAASLVDNLNATISMHLHGAPNNAMAAEMALMRILRTKGRVVEAQADTYRSLRDSLDPTEKRQIEELAKLRGALAYYASEGSRPDEVKRLQAKLVDIQRSLAEKSSALIDISSIVQLEDLREAIPVDAALVEFVRYQPFDIKTRQHKEPHYAVYVLTREGAPMGFDLGTAIGIEASVDSFRAALASRRDLAKGAESLFDSLVKPWLSKLPEKEQLIVAPAGLLNLLPFEVVAPSSGKALLDSHTITYLNCGRQLVQVGGSSSSSNPAVIIGDPDYDSGPQPAEAEGTEAATAAPSDLPDQWERLPGTSEEARVVHELIEGSTLLTAKRAKEESLKQVDSPQILHIATHGYYLGASGVNAPEQARGIVVVGNKTKAQVRDSWVKLGNPLLRSGLVLAGANRPLVGENDGRLTALEATGLDLVGTQLVVMSACETGVGEVTSGEGVFGLRRAMELAGAESQVLSLWQVSDEATTELMKRFYTALMNGATRADALREARLGLAATDKWSHPYFWGAFILSGDWRALH